MNPFLKSARVLRYALVFLGGLAGILLFLLASASINSSWFDQNYGWLIVLNGLVAFALLCLVVLLVFRLVRRYRQGIFGSRLMVRLAMSFGLMGFLPGVVLYIVSVQFLAKSIDSWFNVRVDTALESGLNLGRLAIDNLVQETRAKTLLVVSELAHQSEEQQVLALTQLRDKTSLDEIALVSYNGRLLHATTDNLMDLSVYTPNAALLRQIDHGLPYARLEGEDLESFSGLKVRVLAQLPEHRMGLNFAPRYVMVIKHLPQDLANQAQQVQKAYVEYQQIVLSKQGLRKMFSVTLTLATLLTIFIAIASAFWLSSRLAAPLLWLAEGTREVAKGNFKLMEKVTADAELRELIESFNAMTTQLSEARSRLETNQQGLARANAFLKRLLGSLSAGVLVLDKNFHLRLFNHGAQKIFERNFQALADQPLQSFEDLQGFALSVRAAFADLDENQPNASWQKQLELPRLDDPGAFKVLLVRGSRLEVGDQADYVVVCDDISELVSAQRTVAWGEVARRLAHEIKNPLTPIQLSAERLQMKLADLLDIQHSGILARATKTIINQVTAMKRMVDEFRDYARMPTIQLHALDLNELVQDILGLYGHSEIEHGESRQKVFAKLAENLPLVMGDTSQIRQVIHNLLQNAHDAISGKNQGRVEVLTEYVDLQKSFNHMIRAVRLAISDNGGGFAAEMMVRAFEPYVTNKSGGTGLGLAIVKKIVDEHAAKIQLRNSTNHDGAVIGAVVEIMFVRLANNEISKESLKL